MFPHMLRIFYTLLDGLTQRVLSTVPSKNHLVIEQLRLKDIILYYCLFCLGYFIFLVVIQSYETDVFRAVAIFGNDAMLKCDIPSFVGDFVSVESWVDSEGLVHHPSATISQGKKAHHHTLYSRKSKVFLLISIKTLGFFSFSPVPLCREALYEILYSPTNK